MAEVQTKKGRGCFFYGCLTVLILVLLIAGLAFLGGRMALNKFTSTTPIAIPPVKLSTDEGGRAVKRVQDFTEQLKSGKATDPLELSSDELDYVVRNMRLDFRDTAHLVITNDQIHADLSFPLFLINPMLKGRYYNGSATFDVDVNNGGLDLQFGKGMPGVNQKTHWQPKGNEQGADLIRNLEKIEIGDGKIRLIPKTAPPAP